MSQKVIDALIVGGGPAGLSCALTLARGGREVIVCDEGHPRNERAQVMHNFPALDGINPSDFLKRIKNDLRKYKEVQIVDSLVVEISREKNIFISRFENGSVIKSKKVVLAEGLKDHLPDIPGLKDGWGRSVFQCPYCHAYEYKGDGIGILADEKTVFHVAKLLFGLTQDLVVFLNGKKFLNEEDKAVLVTKGVVIHEEKVESLVMDGDRLAGIKLTNNQVVPRKVLFIKPESRIRSYLGIRLGCRINEGGTFETDENCKSCVHGVYIAGDSSSKMHSVLLACAEGSKAGANVNLEILEEEFQKQINPVIHARKDQSFQL